MRTSYKGKCYFLWQIFAWWQQKKRKEKTHRGANTILPSKPIIGHHLKVSMEKKKAKNILDRY